VSKKNAAEKKNWLYNLSSPPPPPRVWGGVCGVRRFPAGGFCFFPPFSPRPPPPPPPACPPPPGGRGFLNGPKKKKNKGGGCSGGRRGGGRDQSRVHTANGRNRTTTSRRLVSPWYAVIEGEETVSRRVWPCVAKYFDAPKSSWRFDRRRCHCRQRKDGS